MPRAARIRWACRTADSLALGFASGSFAGRGTPWVVTGAEAAVPPIDSGMPLTEDEFLRRLANVEAVVSDVDGVLTDGRIGLSARGDEVRFFHMRDGMAVRLLQKEGIGVAWISAGMDTGLIARRAEMLDLKHVDVGPGDKGPRFLAMCRKLGVSPRDTLYIGDDVNDLAAIERAGASACPCDAAIAVRETVDFVLELEGGHGCFREVVELLMEAREGR